MKNTIKKKKRKIKKYFFIIKILLVACIIFIGICFIDGFYSPRVKEYAKKEVVNEATMTINNILNNNLFTLINTDDIFKSQDDKVIVNTIKLNKVLNMASEVLNANITDMSLNNIFIPYSIIFSEVLFSSSTIGLSIKAKTVGSFKLDIISEMVEYGINNTLLKISLKVTIEAIVMIPLSTEEILVETNIPLIMTIVKGEVPPGLLYQN